MSDVLGPLENYRLRPYDPGPPGPGQVRVAIRAAGVSFVDVLNALGKYQGRASTPFIPGSECAGVVEAVGEGVSGFSSGDPVVASSWGGVFAHAANFPAASVHPMPGGMDFAEGAVFLVSATTAWHALADRGGLRGGETLLVLGAGGATGRAAVQVGKYLGARVIASASGVDKRAQALEAGADAVVDARSPRWREEVKAASPGKPVDVVFDPVGGEWTERAFRTLGWSGRHLVVGFPAGIAALPTNLPLLKAASLVGVNLQQFGSHEPERARDNLTRLICLAEQGLFCPAVTHRFPLADFARAMALVHEARPAGRVVLTMD